MSFLTHSELLPEGKRDEARLPSFLNCPLESQQASSKFFCSVSACLRVGGHTGE